MQVRKYLVVRADGSMRVVTRLPRLSFDEIAFPLRVNIPDTWGRLYSNDAIEVDLPDPPQAAFTAVEDGITPSDDVEVIGTVVPSA